MFDKEKFLEQIKRLNKNEFKETDPQEVANTLKQAGSENDVFVTEIMISDTEINVLFTQSTEYEAISNFKGYVELPSKLVKIEGIQKLVFNFKELLKEKK